MENQIENENEIENEGDEVENTPAAEAAPTAEAAAPAPRKRGRPKGVKVGPRSVAWSCAAIVDDELIHVRLTAPEGSSDDERAGFTADLARAAFESEYGVEPASVLGPFHDHKGALAAATPKKARETVSMSVEDVKLTTQREMAIFKEWRGVAYGIENRDDVMYFMAHTEISPNPDKKRQPPGAKTVLRSALKFENTESN